MSDAGVWLVLGLLLGALVVLVIKHLGVSRDFIELRREADHMRLQLSLQREEEGKRVTRYRKKVEALKGAVEQGAIRTLFQPVVHLGSGEVVGMEALSRFADDRSPETWFKEAAQLGIEVQLEMAALDRALGQLGRMSSGFICLNVSPSTIATPEFTGSLAQADVPNDRIVVELTEHALIENYEQVRDSVDKLRAMGVRLAVDDVGAGFSTLRHVLQLHPDIVKLDRSLVAGLNKDGAQLHMVSALARVAQQMDAAVIAEGIELPDEVNALWSVGVELGQGFLLAVPDPEPMTSVEWSPTRPYQADGLTREYLIP